MKVKKKIEEPVQVSEGFGIALLEFLKQFEDMEKKGELVRSMSGNLNGPFGSKAAYNYSVKLGIEGSDFLLKRAFHPRKRPISHVSSTRRGTAEPELVRPDDIELQEPVVDVFDEGDYMTLVTQMPFVREEDIDLKIFDKILKITANTREGKIEKDIPVSDGGKIKMASFKNGILEIRLSKKK